MDAGARGESAPSMIPCAPAIPSAAMKCPNCGTQAQGKFCPECGTALEPAKCTSCSAKLTPGARYCTQCGIPTRRGGGNNAPFFVVGAGLAVLLVALLISMSRGPGAAAPPQASAPQESGPSLEGGPPALSGNMRENADRLFNRVMTERESGDTAAAKRFVPMAVQAYQSSGELDADGWYHLSVLQTFGGDP